jgi:Zn-dependent M16 (insulinase) family peptidase
VSALLVLFDYLTETSVAPLKQDFVQTEDPYCHSVGLGLTEQTTCEVSLYFQGVPVAKLGDIKTRFSPLNLLLKNIN